MDITSTLKEIGLTEAETKIYLTLIKFSPLTAGQIIENTGIQNSVVHLTLRRLISKGFVTYTTKGRSRFYSASDPQNIVSYIHNKEQELQKIIPLLKSQQKRYERQEVKIFEGFSGFKIMLYEFIEDAREGDEYLYFAFNPDNPANYKEVFEFYREFEKERIKYGIELKGIAPKYLKNKYLGRDLNRVLFVNFPVPTNISIFKNKIIMTPWETKEISFLIISRQLAESFRQYFYSIWNKYKKNKKP